ncbi:berberine bridge enzyme-like 21 [Silene latifolia]|uniref:berberine bridge enzyme-like 21 n=1 Tax=Silene latifolia TaxID=37657 RepID=UPI003D78590A
MKTKFDFHQFFYFLLIISSFSLAKSSNDTYNNLLQCLNKQTSSQNMSKILYSKDNNQYTTVLYSYIRNSRFTYPTTPKPILIITPFNPSQVSASVICSNKLGLHLKIRSGGHDYEGLSYVSDDPFVVLDMNNFKNVSVDIESGTVYVEAGATLGEFYYNIVKKSNVHGFPAGQCPTVGIGGHFTGGGYGFMMRKHGLSVDHIIDAEVVDYKGRILNRCSMGEDLFWAIRGGGGASFAVVLSFTVKLVTVPETVTVFNVKRFLADNVTDFVYKWPSVMKNIDENLFMRLLLQPENDPKNTGNLTVGVTVISYFLGDSETLVNLLNSKLPELGIEKADCHEMSWGKGILFLLNHDKETPYEVLLSRNYTASYQKNKSDYVQKPIEKQDLELLWKKLIELEKPILVFSAYGGKMNKIPATRTPFPHRKGNLFKIQYFIYWKDNVGQDIEAKNIGILRKLYEFMTPYVSKNPRGAFLNYRDIDIGVSHNWTYDEGEVYGRKYFLGNFDRLVKVKTKVDPHNFFRYEQSLPTRHVSTPFISVNNSRLTFFRSSERSNMNYSSK